MGIVISGVREKFSEFLAQDRKSNRSGFQDFALTMKSFSTGARKISPNTNSGQKMLSFFEKALETFSAVAVEIRTFFAFVLEFFGAQVTGLAKITTVFRFFISVLRWKSQKYCPPTQYHASLHPIWQTSERLSRQTIVALFP